MGNFNALPKPFFNHILGYSCKPEPLSSEKKLYTFKRRSRDEMVFQSKMNFKDATGARTFLQKIRRGTMIAIKFIPVYWKDNVINEVTDSYRFKIIDHKYIKKI